MVMVVVVMVMVMVMVMAVVMVMLVVMVVVVVVGLPATALRTNQKQASLCSYAIWQRHIRWRYTGCASWWGSFLGGLYLNHYTTT